MATQRQGLYIANLIMRGADEYPTIATIWEAQKQVDSFVDDRQVTLGKKIEARITTIDAGIVINWFLGKKDIFGKDISTKLVFQILTNANLIN